MSGGAGAGGAFLLAEGIGSRAGADRTVSVDLTEAERATAGTSGIGGGSLGDRLRTPSIPGDTDSAVVAAAAPPPDGGLVVTLLPACSLSTPSVTTVWPDVTPLLMAVSSPSVGPTSTSAIATVWSGFTT